MIIGEPQQFTVRADYPHLLISACQRFLASVLVLEPQAFVSAVDRLTTEAPPAQSPAEAVMKWFVLKDALARAADNRHNWFHQRIDNVACAFRPRVSSAPMTFAPPRIVSLLNDYAIEYTRDFDAVHCWPPAVRAAAQMRASPDRSWHVEDLARAVYVSPATLARSFGRIFGATVLQYHARLRLRGVVEQVRANGATIEGILVERGYRSPKDCYRLFRRLTGMTLADVRRLSDLEYSSLLESLALPNGECRTDPPPAL